MSENVIGQVLFHYESKLVGFENKALIDTLVKQNNLNTLDQFNALALILLKQFNPDVYNAQSPDDLKEWHLGAQDKEVAEYLFSFLPDEEKAHLNHY